MNLIAVVLVSAVLQTAYSDDAPVSDPLRNPSGWSSAPAPGWSSAPPPSGWYPAPGWGAPPAVAAPPVSEGTTESVGMTMLINQVAGSNIISEPAILQVNASEPGATVSIYADAYPDASFYAENPYYSESGTISAGTPGTQQLEMDNGADTSTSSMFATGVQNGSFASNFTSTAGISINQLAFSNYGQASNGTNLVSSGGGGWRAVEDKGWGSPGWGDSPTNGTDSSMGAVVVITGLAQNSEISDDLYAALTGFDNTTSDNTTVGNNTANFNSSTYQSTDQYTYLYNYDGNMGNVTTGTQYVGTESFSEANLDVGVIGANAIAFEGHPSDTSSFSIGGIVLSAFTNANNGTNFNSGGSGWGWGNNGTGWKSS